MTRENLFLTGTAMLLVLAQSTAANAQSALPEGQRDERGAGLQDIVVTAQKRTENLQKVPLVVNVVDQETLKDQALTRFDQLNTLVPNLTARPRSGGTDFEIRGLGNFQTGEPAVQTYIDGVYMPSRETTSADLPDVASIQVLKGPQGTLFGRNATGGVIVLTTEAPPSTFRGRGEFSYGTYETASGRIWLGGPISNTLGFTASANYSRQGEGWGRNLINGDDVYRLFYDLNTRGKLVWQPGDATTVTLIGDYQHRKSNRYANYQPLLDTVARAGRGGTPYVRTSNLYNSSANYHNIFKFEGGGGSARIDQDLPCGIKLMSLTSYRKLSNRYAFTSDGPNPDPTVLIVDQRRRTASQEFQFTSPESDKFTWVAGVYLFRDIYNVDPLGILFPVSLAPITGQRQDSRTRTNIGSAAIYAQGVYSILPGTRLTVGGRYTYELRKYRGQSTVLTAAGASVPGGVFQDNITIKRPSWRLALEQDFSDQVTGYVSYSRGVKSGGFQPLATIPTNLTPLPSPFKDELLDDVEAGVKTKLFDNRLRLNIAGFHYSFRNIQLTSYASGATVQALVFTGGDATVYGLDADFEAKLSDDFTLRGGLGLIHSRFKGGVLIDFLQPNPAGGAIATRQDPRGNDLPYAPHISGNIGLNYDHEFAFGKINLNSTVSHVGKQYVAADNFVRLPSTTQLSASVGWTSRSGRLTVQLWGRNLTNAILYAQVVNNANVGYLADVAEPRTYGLTFRVNFGG